MTLVRLERHHLAVTAYDNDSELLRRMTVEAAALKGRKAAGTSEHVEHLSGFVKELGYATARNLERLSARLGRSSDVLWLN